MYYYFSFIRRTVLFGLISFVLIKFLFGIPFEIFWGLIYTYTLAGGFCKFLFFSLVAYPLLVLFDGTIGYIVSLIRYKEGDSHKPTVLGKMFGPFPSDILLPITNTIIFFKMISHKEFKEDGLTRFQKISSKAEVIVGFIWTIILMAFLGVGMLLMSLYALV